MTAMLLRRTPAPPLGAVVECLWANERDALPHPRERNLPSGHADLIIALRQEYLGRYADAADHVGWRLRGVMFQGPHERHFLRSTSTPSSVVGVHFRAGGAVVFAGVPLAELVDRSVAAGDLWGRAAQDLRE